MFSIKEITVYRKDLNAHIHHPLQTWAWGEARIALGIPVIRVVINAGDLIDGYYQISLHKIPKTSWFVGYIPRSLPPKSDHIKILRDFFIKRKVIALTFEPLADIDFNIASFKKSFMSLLPPWTQMIDISGSEEEILKHMDSQARYNIRLAERKGVKVSEMSDDHGFSQFWQLYNDTEKRQGYLGHSKKHHEIIWQKLHESSIAHIFIASHENRAIAGFEVFVWKDVLYYPYGGSDFELRNYKGPNLGIYSLIRFAKSLGLKYIDLWGSLPPEYNHKHPWAGFTMFKQTFGTSFHKYGETYDLVIHPLGYVCYKYLYIIRAYALKIIAKFQQIIRNYQK